MKTTDPKQTDILTPRQSSFLKAYSSPDSPTFGNAYRSAVNAGYSDKTARNITHLRPDWLSENIGQIAAIIEPEQVMQKLTAIINDPEEPTIIKLKALEMTMKAHNMLVQSREQAPQVVSLNIDLSGSGGG